MEKKVCCFIGHRPSSLPFGYNEQDPRCERLKQVLRDAIVRQIEAGATHFISGMARGADTFAAETVLDLKQEYPHITLEAVIPCETQAARWREIDRDRYYAIIEQCDKETLLQKRYTSECMMKRNQYLAKNADILIAVWNERTGGASNTVTYAKCTGKEVVVINPVELLD